MDNDEIYRVYRSLACGSKKKIMNKKEFQESFEVIIKTILKKENEMFFKKKNNEGIDPPRSITPKPRPIPIVKKEDIFNEHQEQRIRDIIKEELEEAAHQALLRKGGLWYD